eukprot:2531518-Amphidinium_carterae.1
MDYNDSGMVLFAEFADLCLRLASGASMYLKREVVVSVVKSVLVKRLLEEHGVSEFSSDQQEQKTSNSVRKTVCFVASALYLSSCQQSCLVCTRTSNPQLLFLRRFLLHPGHCHFSEQDSLGTVTLVKCNLMNTGRSW